MQSHNDFSPQERAFLDTVKLSSLAGVAACPPPAELLALSSGVLPDSARARIEEHMRRCSICQGMARDLPEVVRVNATREEKNRIRTRVFAEAGPELIRPRISWSRCLVPAFALACVIVIGVRWLYVERRSHQKATASVSGSVKPSLPDILQLDRPAAVSPPALIWRGAKPEQGLDEGLRSALDLYRKGDDDAARALLETLTVNYPNSAEPFFYLGICQLFLGQNTEAVTSLRRSRQLATEPLASEAAWYLSVALVREGNRSQAAEILKQLCQSPGSYQTRACAGLDELSRPQNSQP